MESALYEENRRMHEEEDDWCLSEAYANIPVPEMGRNQQKDKRMVPITLLIACSIQRSESRRLMRVLLDSGGSHTIIHARALPPNVSPYVSEGGSREMQTIVGSFETKRE
eukprot:7544344-Ditylum_brightwellii.AAC.1